MTKRILLGLLMIVFLAGLLYLDWRLDQAYGQGRNVGVHQGAAFGDVPVSGLPVAVLFLALTAMAFLEVARLAARSGVLILTASGMIGAVMLATFPAWWRLIESTRGPQGSDLLLTLALIVILTFAEQMIRHRTADALRRIACTFLAVIYLGVGGAMILAIRLDYGVPVLLLFLAAVKFADIGAYFVGSAIGRHKLIRWLSPNKSWEGLVGGLAAAAGVSMLLTAVLRIDGIHLWQAAAFGVVVGLAGLFADLCESLLKRSADMKDSGSSIPGFGGVLDVLDSPLLAAPIAYLLLAVMV